MAEDLGELISRIYDAGCAGTSWDEVMGDIAGRLGASGHLSYEIAKDPARGTSSVVSNSWVADDALAQYFGHYAGCNIWAASDAMVPGAVFTSSMLYPDHRLKRTEYWSGWLRHVDVFYVVGGIVHDDAGSRTKASFVRPEGRGGFDAQAVRLVQAVAPHLQRSIAAQKRMARVEALLTPLLQALDDVDHGVLVLHDDGRVVHMNACARELLQPQGPVRIHGDRLEMRCPELAARFDALVRPGQPASAEPVYFLLPGPDGAPLQSVLVRLPDRVAGAGHLALYIKRRHGAGLPADMLRRLYGLTAAEAELAQALAAGSTAADHAQARGVSIHTARSQLKSVLMKLGVSRQADVVQIVRGFLHRHRAPH